MSRKNHLFQDTVNRLLDQIQNYHDDLLLLPGEANLAKQLDVSRSTVRKSIAQLDTLQIVSKATSGWKILRAPIQSDYFDIGEIEIPKEEQVESHFMQLILSGKLKPGDKFSELELSRQSSCNTVSVREYLLKFSRFGLIEKKPRSQWQMKTFDESFVDQLYEVRHLFEMNALANFMALATTDTKWQELEQLLRDHKDLEFKMDTQYHLFSTLDQRFHQLLHSAKQNQFINQFYDVISFVFHYHYQWDKSDEKERNCVALQEHLIIMARMLTGDYRGATSALESHLNTAKQTLKNTAFFKH
jgi:DNA-binding GntR family transcriptional regulator